MHSLAQGPGPTVRARVPEPALLPVDGLVFQARLFQDLLCGGLLGVSSLLVLCPPPVKLPHVSQSELLVALWVTNLTQSGIAPEPDL